MSKDSKKQEIALVGESRAVAYCRALSETQRTVVAMSIVQCLGQNTTRAGSRAWEGARLRVVSELIAKHVDLDEGSGEMLAYLDERTGDKETDAARRDFKNRVEACADYLAEEGREEENPILAGEVAVAGV